MSPLNCFPDVHVILNLIGYCVSATINNNLVSIVVIDFFST